MSKNAKISDHKTEFTDIDPTASDKRIRIALGKLSAAKKRSLIELNAETTDDNEETLTDLLIKDTLMLVSILFWPALIYFLWF